MTTEEKINTLTTIIQECEDYQWQRKEALFEIIKDLEQEANYNSVNFLAESKLKNPKAKNFDVVRFVVDNSELSTFEIIEKAYLMGVSEKEHVLDKYRTEIRV